MPLSVINAAARDITGVEASEHLARGLLDGDCGGRIGDLAQRWGDRDEGRRRHAFARELQDVGDLLGRARLDRALGRIDQARILSRIRLRGPVLRENRSGE